MRNKSTSARNTGAVAIFIGALLVAIFAVGLIAINNSDAFFRKKQYDFALQQFVEVCTSIWLPAGVIGIPTFVISLARSLIRESREKE